MKMLLKTKSYLIFLKEELKRRQDANPLYSQRAFARQLGLSPGEFSEIMRQKRKMSVKSAVKIAKNLQLNSTETKHLLHLVNLEQGKETSSAILDGFQSKVEKKQFELDQFQLISDWYTLTILSLADTKDFSWNEGWIAKRLGISAPTVRTALERLLRLNLIIEKNGNKKVATDYVLSPDGIASEAIKTYHRTMLQKAKDALDFQTLKEREISGLSLAINNKDVESIRKDIQDFQEMIVEKYGNSKNKNEVYQLEFALFKITENTKHEN